jgi:hypothetical protein
VYRAGAARCRFALLKGQGSASGLLECCNFTLAAGTGQVLCDSLHDAGRGMQNRAPGPFSGCETS